MDFFVYMPTGEVQRYHPGASAAQDATPQVMRLGSPLFHFDVAKETGVGSAMHTFPPGFQELVPAPSRGSYDDSEVVAFAMKHLDLLSTYDMQRNSTKKLIQAAVTIPGLRGDITDGKLFPWWLSLGDSVMKNEIPCNTRVLLVMDLALRFD